MQNSHGKVEELLVVGKDLFEGCELTDRVSKVSLTFKTWSQAKQNLNALSDFWPSNNARVNFPPHDLDLSRCFSLGKLRVRGFLGAPDAEVSAPKSSDRKSVV